MSDAAPVSPIGLRVAIIGLGRMGIRHIEAAKSLGMNIVGAADLNSEVRSSSMSHHGLPANKTFEDGHSMLAEIRPDALIVATTAPTHAPFVLSAVEHGTKFILCEKPMASSLEQAEAMMTACRQNGVKLGINHQMRFMEQYTRVKRTIATDALGPLSSILVAGSNFGLAMNASHYFEMFRYISGEDVQTVQAWFETDKLANPRGSQFDDASGRLLAKAASGTSMFIDFSARAGWGVQVTYICRNGQINVDELRGEMRVVARQAQHRDLPTTRYGMPVDVEELTIAPADVIQPTAAVWSAMLGGAPYPDGEAGAHSLRCLVAAHASNREGNAAFALNDPRLPATEVFHWA